MQLSEVQKRFTDTMLDHPDVVENPEEVFAALFNEGDIPLPERLKVYRNNIVGGLTDTLVISFPTLEKLVGKEFLEGMARSFILQSPPDKGTLNTYGRGFDEFIRRFEPAKSLPYLPDVAAFEIAMTESYYARNDEPLSGDELAAIDPAELTELNLELRSSVYFVSSSFPLTAIRDFCQREDEDDDQTLDLDQGSVRLMIYRPDLEVQIAELEAAEYEMLQKLQGGTKLSAAVEEILKTYEDFDFQAFLQKHLELETFCTLETNT